MILPLLPRPRADRPSYDGGPATCAGLGANGSGMRKRGLKRLIRFPV